ncbi:Hemerythrin-like metal-binding domain protein [Candidatus Electrothrix laxa]
MKMTYDWTDEHYSGLEKIDPQYGRFFSIVKELNEASDKSVSRRLRTEMSLEWRDEYNVGVKKIDSQHKNFFRLIKKISNLHLNGTGHVNQAIKLDRLLDELQGYAKLHFQTEEKLMARYGYPMINDQKKEHEIIMSELSRQVRAIRCSKGSTAKLVYFLVQWFIKHTVYSDRDVGLFIIQQRKARAFRFNLKGSAQKITGFLNQPLTTVKIMAFLNQPLTTVCDYKDDSAYPVS